MKGSIFRQILLGHLAIVLLLTVAVALTSWHLSEDFSFELLKRHLRDLAYGLRPKVKGLTQRGDLEALQTLVQRMKAETGARITVIDPKGVVLADSEEDPARMENHRERPEVKEAMEGKVGVSVRFSTTLREEMLYVAVPFQLPGGQGVLRTSLFLRNIRQFLGKLKGRLFLTALVFALFALLYSYFSSRRISRPIKEVVRATSRVAKGDFDVEVPSQSKGEVGELSEHFNEMAKRLKELFEENLRRREELEGIFSALQDGLLVMDREGKVLFSNKKAEEVLGEALQGVSLWEVDNPALRQALSRAKREGGLREEVEIGGRVFFLSASFLPVTGQTLVLLHDITHLKRMEEMKRDLVSNVSHELRTPLTAIKGFLETLEEETDEKLRAQCLEVIKRHVKRLTNLVEDLLVLSELEGRELKLELQETDLREVFKEILPPFEQKAREKGLRISVEVPRDLGSFKANPFRLGQVLFNLLDNAVKYTERGEIRLAARREGGRMEIEVSDTGIGIPKEHLGRIFERFYVVDKSRSRRLGGTGLGLSIVKHIVLLHGGEIKVESTPGVGTRFKVRLPL